MRCNDDGSAVLEAAPLHLKTITSKGACKLQRAKKIDRMYMIFMQPADDEEPAMSVEEVAQIPE